MSHQLRSSPPSPFGRKIKIAAYLTGLLDEMEVLPTDTLDPEDSIRKQNPLGKIPALILESGEVLYDSRVILEWIDVTAREKGRKGIIPTGKKERFAALTLQALADGLMDAALLQVYEGRMRPVEMHSRKWLDYQAEKVERALKELDRTTRDFAVTGSHAHVGQIAVACALGYLDLRFPTKDWRADHSALNGWLEDFAAKIPAFAKTRFEG